MIYPWTTVDLGIIIEKLHNNNYDLSSLTEEEFAVYFANGSPIKNCNSDSCILTEEEVNYTEEDLIYFHNNRINCLIEVLKNEEEFFNTSLETYENYKKDFPDLTKDNYINYIKTYENGLLTLYKTILYHWN